ncbi:tyrosine--tRNA ligase [Altericista sp. CCNU0014]|uniref:tyrosine--tRNA ligase n=1 Tax=Altericista sp. CCNU0014 TaxID=3082949 RepID=UPI00385087C6
MTYSWSPLLQRGVSDIFPNLPDSRDPAENIAAKLQQAIGPLRIKFGIDPTGSEVHLGHSIPIRKLRAFQDEGHTAVLIFGDFTARIGDPTGKSEVRQQLSEADVAANVKTYIEQIRPILDFETPGRLEIRHNSEWLAQLDLSATLQLLTTMTVGQMLAKEGFSERYNKGNPIFLHEFLYPIMQGYDSVAVRADVEIGGTDQKFNIAVGRDLQRIFGQKPQFGLLMPILLGTDGVQKMSKSLNNYVGLAENPVSLYSKLEKVPDSIIEQYFELLTDLPLDELPTAARDRQKLLALEIVGQFYGKEVAQQTQKSVVAMIKEGKASDTELVPEFSLTRVQFPVKLFYLLGACGLCPTSSDARRQIQGGAVKLDGLKVSEVDWTVASSESLNGKVLQVGKKKFVRFVS